MAAILIVEDRPIDRKFLATLLKSAGHEVAEAADGDEGLRVAARVRPDLVISDLLMPTVDGYEFVRRMRDIPGFSATPVIFYTATYHEREAHTLAGQCGADVLTKPADPKAILAKVRSTLQARRSTPEREDPLQFSRDHVRVVSSALVAKVKDLEASEHRMAAIVDIAHQIAGERDENVLLERVCAAAREVTLAQQAAIGLVADDGSRVARLVTSGIDEDVARRMTVPPIDAAVVAPVVNDRQALRLTNSDGRPESLGFPADHPETFSCLVVPIATSHRVYGYLGLRNKLGADAFSDADERVAMALATQAGIAYENAQLLAELRTHAEALEHEVADRRRAEAALRENEARTQLALAAAQTGIWESDLEAGKLAWSDTLSATFGWSPEQAPRSHEEFYELIHADDRALVKEGFERAITLQTDFVNEFRTVWPDGTIHWIASRARVLTDASGKPSRMLGVAMDITERKSLENQLRQAQKMEAVGQLAGGVAHDFNNLLTAIHGYATLVAETLTKSDHRRDDMNEIIKASDRAADLTRQLLAFSRRQVLQPRRLDVNRVVADTSKMLRRLIGEHIDLVTRLAPDVAAVVADAGQVDQILMNLAVNARDAMPNGGRLSIETANVVLDDVYSRQHMVPPGSYVMLAVSDNGIGMDADTKQKIFEPFFTTKGRDQGTGLGLATVYGIVKQSGGHIFVYSEPGRGATFKVYLPRVDDNDAVQSERPELAPNPTGSETILLVEDEQAVRFLSRTLLERAGYRVLDAADPAHAEGMFHKNSGAIDLLVTDVVMPGSSGPSLFKRLSASHPRLKVLYMSGYTDDAIVHNTGLPPDVMFLQKPFTANRLMCKVREALDR